MFVLICLIWFLSTKYFKKFITHKQVKENITDTNVIELYNNFHLGDNMFSMIYFYNIKKYIEDNNIKIDYYCNKDYHKQLSEFKCSNNINILNIEEGEKGLNCWIGNTELKVNHYDNIKTHNKLDIFLYEFFNNISNMLNIPVVMEKFSYTDPDLLVRYDNLPEKYKDIDILIGNSNPNSGQYSINDSIWNQHIKELDKKYKIVTTKKADDIASTQDDNLTIKDISAISTKAKIIISVNTGIFPGLLNTYTLENAKKIFVFDNGYVYYTPKIITITDNKQIDYIKIEDLDSLLK